MTALAVLLGRVNAAFGWDFASFSALIEQLVPPGRWRRPHDPACQAVADSAAFLPETLYVVSDESYREGVGAFAVRRDDLSGFIRAYPERHGVDMFDSDTFIIGIDSKLVWMFHHEGVWTLFDGRRPAAVR
ncbi:hypothetical protein [Massilia genomosp. 1]|uniref:Uncharacterized protein n=1 Tax=Massilia genomosp. 1 TaxID=2609280 RepID=A0ABX0MNH9_9BURK|nr:hypothetical protein [Massilia genomosp. 1]NHZ61490.1 hypothetical protein [Massilia genomosp. 1]